jgi:uncharacterized protein YecE (DUF72 family)
VLLQLFPYFQNEGPAPSNLKGLLDESRNEMDPEVLEILREKNVANVQVDGPGLPISKDQTADHAYVRFHGRNYDIWYREEMEDDHRLDRYDYLYRKEQAQAQGCSAAGPVHVGRILANYSIG